MVLDGLEYVLDHRELAGFGTTVSNATSRLWRYRLGHASYALWDRLSTTSRMLGATDS